MYYKCEEDDAGAGGAAGAVTAAAQGSEQIVDSIKHISALVSSVREVLPGRRYFVPDTRNKKDPLTETAESFDALLRSQQVPPARLLVNTYTGVTCPSRPGHVQCGRMCAIGKSGRHLD